MISSGVEECGRAGLAAGIRDRRLDAARRAHEAGAELKFGATRLGFALLLKFFEVEARFPESVKEVPAAAVEYVAQQVKAPSEAWADYDWQSEAIQRHRDLQQRHDDPARPGPSARLLASKAFWHRASSHHGRLVRRDHGLPARPDLALPLHAVVLLVVGDELEAFTRSRSNENPAPICRSAAVPSVRGMSFSQHRGISYHRASSAALTRGLERIPPPKRWRGSGPRRRNCAAWHEGRRHRHAATGRPGTDASNSPGVVLLLMASSPLVLLSLW
ncbi:DUF4158 domain-containing protein [Dactylosporangium sp. CA-233914]|uniref:DUF4158 domain-containing protein n=1 Tax=Dactylosporangium sp. CA-233914 TaxID=3239934 RepID=UPI003D8D4381